jgi:hypothetical protein
VSRPPISVRGLAEAIAAPCLDHVDLDSAQWSGDFTFIRRLWAPTTGFRYDQQCHFCGGGQKPAKVQVGTILGPSLVRLSVSTTQKKIIIGFSCGQSRVSFAIIVKRSKLYCIQFNKKKKIKNYKKVNFDDNFYLNTDIHFDFEIFVNF